MVHMHVSAVQRHDRDESKREDGPGGRGRKRRSELLRVNVSADRGGAELVRRRRERVVGKCSSPSVSQVGRR